MDICINDDTEIEHKFISFIFFVFDADRMTENPIFAVRVTNGNVAVTEGLTRNDIFSHGLEIKEPGFVDVEFWDDASWRTLVDDFGACVC